MKSAREAAGLFYGSVLLALVIGAIAIHPQSPAGQTPGMSVTTTDPSGNPCDEMGAMAGMNVMGESMAAMANHMASRPCDPGSRATRRRQEP